MRADIFASNQRRLLMHPGIGQINIAPLRRLLRCAHRGRREINRFCTYVKLINDHSSRLSFQLSSAYLCAKDRQAINVPCLSMRLGHAFWPQDRDQDAVPFVRLCASQHRAPSRRRYEMRCYLLRAFKFTHSMP